jgi:hypothetical protein
MEKVIDDFSEALITASNISFNRYRTTKKTTTHRTVPWWSVDLTVVRKEQTPFADSTREQKTMRNSEKYEKCNISKVKQHTQLP